MLIDKTKYLLISIMFNKDSWQAWPKNNQGKLLTLRKFPYFFSYHRPYLETDIYIKSLAKEEFS